MDVDFDNTLKPNKDNKLYNSYYDYENDFLTLSSFNNLIMEKEKSCLYSEQNEKINLYLYCKKVKKNFPIAKTTLQGYSYSNNPSTVKITYKKKTPSKNINSENLSCDNNTNSQDNAYQENKSSFKIQKAEDVFAPYAHLWTLCKNCERSIYKQYAKKNKYICKHCEFHLPMESSDRIESLIDLGTWDPKDETMVSINPYDEVLREKRKEEDLKPFSFLNGLLFLDLEDLLLKENLDLSPILEMKEFLEITGFKEAQAYQIIGAFHQLREYLKMVARVEDETDDNDIMMTATNDKIIIYEKIIIEKYKKYEKELEEHIHWIPVDVKDDLIFFSYLQVPYQIQYYYYLNRNEEQFTPEQTVTDGEEQTFTDGEEQTVTDGEEQTATDRDQSTPEQTSGDGDPSIPEQYQDFVEKYKQYLDQEEYLDLPEEYKQYLYGAEEYTVKETVKELLERFCLESKVEPEKLEMDMKEELEEKETNLTSANNEDANQNSEKSTKSEEDTTKSESEESDISYEEEDILYIDKVDLNQKDIGLTDAVQTGIGQLDSIPVALAVMDFQFIGGSMGSVVGEKITRLIEYATYKSLPLIICCASGGARMQEGSFSLMQMAKISSVLLNYQLNKNLFLVSLLTSPTTGGVTASFGMLGNIIIGEPDAIIAFAGKRVIEEIMKIEVPEGIQEAEYLFEKGSLDSIVPRNLLKGVLSELLKFHSFFPLNQN